MFHPRILIGNWIGRNRSGDRSKMWSKLDMIRERKSEDDLPSLLEEETSGWKGGQNGYFLSPQVPYMLEATT